MCLCDHIPALFRWKRRVTTFALVFLHSSCLKAGLLLHFHEKSGTWEPDCKTQPRFSSFWSCWDWMRRMILLQQPCFQPWWSRLGGPCSVKVFCEFQRPGWKLKSVCSKRPRGSGAVCPKKSGRLSLWPLLCSFLDHTLIWEPSVRTPMKLNEKLSKYINLFFVRPRKSSHSK